MLHCLTTTANQSKVSEIRNWLQSVSTERREDSGRLLLRGDTVSGGQCSGAPNMSQDCSEEAHQALHHGRGNHCWAALLARHHYLMFCEL